MKSKAAMKSVMFFPWIGKNYSNGGMFKKKILILGESHYGAEDCGSDFTSAIIEDQLTPGEKRHAIYTKLAKLFVDRDFLSDEEKKEFWHSVAFYNYTQSSASEPRESPTDEMWSDSEKPFGEVMENLKPDFLLVCGRRLWGHLPGECGVDWSEGPTIKGEETWYYKGKISNTLSLVICHPSSSRFSYDSIPIVKKALTLS